MTTEIHTGNRKVTYGSGSLSIAKTSTGRVLRAPLTAQDRRALANALDPIRATYDDGGPVPGITADQGGQWTVDDLPSEVLCSHMDHDSFLCDEMREMLAERLNAHYPKPELSAMDYAEIVAFEAARATRAERERDAAVERAEGMDRDYRECQESLIEVSLERDGWKAGGQEWELLAKQERARAEAAERVLRERDEQAVDPIEALAEELFGVAHPGATWSRMPRGVQRQYRAIAAHVLGQEADQ